ncbi:uncharacterized protein ARB_05055 [Trichophyton benhamiae CBS 112371]|uniref:Uncharacterized protein n=1 Tax=Arthroderma benhamiae (strain ATCC MYA-4681 / CBS 112371) TaxID=663331 RepID=D4AL58_ARTBC|nr:uncharacterized protein ARB_05055 [Trichophyton benhamiae CBS 112371]EFE36117.1 hypothetical protein ARB_05055 [Trichophyton benhamiae CBS 112371]
MCAVDYSRGQHRQQPAPAPTPATPTHTNQGRDSLDSGQLALEDEEDHEFDGEDDDGRRERGEKCRDRDAAGALPRSALLVDGVSHAGHPAGSHGDEPG